MKVKLAGINFPELLELPEEIRAQLLKELLESRVRPLEMRVTIYGSIAAALVITGLVGLIVWYDLSPAFMSPLPAVAIAALIYIKWRMVKSAVRSFLIEKGVIKDWGRKGI